MPFAPFEQFPQFQVTVEDVPSALALVRKALKEGPRLPVDYDPAQYLAALLGSAPDAARGWLRAAVEQLLVVGTELERSWILGTFAIFDDDWRVEKLKELIEKAPAWLGSVNPRDSFGRPLGRLVVDASLGRVVHLHPGLATNLEAHAPGWGAGELFLQWFVKRDPAGAGLAALEAYGGDLSSSAGVLGIVYAKSQEPVLRRVATKLASVASRYAQQDFLWSVADYAADPGIPPKIAKILGLPPP